jgi:hypothetical protein
LHDEEAALVAPDHRRPTPRRLLRVVDGDTLPARLPFWNLVVARDDGEDWSVGMRTLCTKR